MFKLYSLKSIFTEQELKKGKDTVERAQPQIKQLVSFMGCVGNGRFPYN